MIVNNIMNVDKANDRKNIFSIMMAVHMAEKVL